MPYLIHVLHLYIEYMYERRRSFFVSFYGNTVLFELVVNLITEIYQLVKIEDINLIKISTQLFYLNHQKK